ncbi:EAL domain-containing protein [Albimonas sp. CAU 1670]|uniref:putative bifunctional diguanylate cyclase/phosphodiesterase n=1 Tax=Albimonas sp. CAU 1670 TaxID=3032599 RepID=UPI0023DC6E61|nr:EAL domain-containing protein [Albimonas sp. CAU 1670]MDF2233959.1 EAL domain-containing protein [Albimonas sp. CAU 1670]
MRLPARAMALACSAEGVFAMCWLAVYVLASELDAMDHVLTLMEAHEDWELDELVLGFTVAGALATATLVRRGLNLRRAEFGRDRAEGEVAWLARHDPLTGLFNRRFVDEMIAREGAERRRAPDRRTGERPWGAGGDRRDSASPGADGLDRGAVLALDLDGFKQVNALVGHDGGDALLRETAMRLRALVPGGVIARLGGDEFAIFVDRVQVPDAMALGARICAALAEPMEVPGGTVRVGASVGVALLPEDARSPGPALGMADAALYAAKDGGRGHTVRYRAEMGDALTRRAALETGLRRALAPGEKAAEDPAISLVYQPMFDLETGRLAAFEALARWTGADGAPAASPEEFVPLAEETGQIMRLSERLLAEACAEATRWPAEVRLSFNLSPAQMGDPELAGRLLATLEASGLPPERLQVEVTETAVMRCPDMGALILDGLREAGVQVALDDFGAGYSSLAQLARLSFDAIKIDRGFVSRAGDEGDGDEILAAVMGLARGLGVRATAEGIETQAQLARLRDLGCACGQGYLLGRPVEAEAAMAVIARDRDGTAWAAPAPPSPDEIRRAG